jgi:hypothetical protein
MKTEYSKASPKDECSDHSKGKMRLMGGNPAVMNWARRDFGVDVRAGRKVPAFVTKGLESGLKLLSLINVLISCP